MAVRMASLARDKKTGSWKARKAIPHAIRLAYAAEFGAKYEAKFTAPASLDNLQAKAEFSEWEAEVHRRFHMLAAKAKGIGRDLSHKEAHALAGRWYAWFISALEREPGNATDWRLLSDQYADELADAVQKFDPAGDDPNSDFDWLESEPALGPGLAVVARFSKAEAFLLEVGDMLSVTGRTRFLTALVDDLSAAYGRLQRISAGDYSPDTRPQRFPAQDRATGLTCAALFSEWIKAKRPAPNTEIRWRGEFAQMDAYFDSRDAGAITEADALEWLEDRRSKQEGVLANEPYLTAARAVFAWATQTKKLKANPFAGLKGQGKKNKPRLRERSLREAEAKIILNSTFVTPPKNTRPWSVAARRWVFWLLAYSGARPGEICQLRKEDVSEEQGVWLLHLTPEAGTIKDQEFRKVPIHSHLIEQGFLDFVRKAKPGPLFYNAALLPRYADAERTRRHPSEKVRMHLAGLVRELGVTDPNISPNHAWRHTWKTKALRAGIDQVVRDFIQGHKPNTVGDNYYQLEGEDGLKILAAEMKKFPRYQL